MHRRLSTDEEEVPVARTPLAQPANQHEVCCPSVVASPLSADEAEDLAGLFAALADPVRLRLLSLVAQAPEVCSCDMQPTLGKSQPTISHHTKILSDAGLIRGEKRGRWVWWSIVPERLEALRTALG